jgi:hypothetical protein
MTSPDDRPIDGGRAVVAVMLVGHTCQKAQNSRCGRARGSQTCVAGVERIRCCGAAAAGSDRVGGGRLRRLAPGVGVLDPFGRRADTGHQSLAPRQGRGRHGGWSGRFVGAKLGDDRGVRRRRIGVLDRRVGSTSARRVSRGLDPERRRREGGDSIDCRAVRIGCRRRRPHPPPAGGATHGFLDER